MTGTLTRLTVNEDFEFMVTGILENLPSNIHFHFDFLISYAFIKQIDNSERFAWSYPGFHPQTRGIPEI